MTFETIDWEAEAARLQKAFGVEKECGFHGENPNQVRFLSVAIGGFHNYSSFGDGAEFTVDYSKRNRLFRLSKTVKGGRSAGVFVSLFWDGTVDEAEADRKHQSVAHLPECLARILLHLGLLTDEVEAALQVAISQHQKMEWSLEYEAQ